MGTTNEQKTKYLIIGNSAGGIGAAEAIRATDKTGSVTIVSDEPYPAYSRPLISEHLASSCSIERMQFRPAGFYEANNIKTIFGTKATRLDLSSHIVEMENGEKIGWEKLLIAAGGKPIVPKLEGINRKGVFTFGSLDDAKAIARFIDQPGKRVSRVVVIGAGLIGVTVTEALIKRKLEVTMVEMQKRILSTILDEETSDMAQKVLAEKGVRIITGRTVAGISGYPPDEATGVVLDNDQPLPCDMVIVAIGVQPRLELIAGTSIKKNRGIVVDSHMATSAPGVYACGDVAEAYDFVYGENRLTPIWPNAYWGGRVAGFNMAGVKAEYTGGTAMNSIKYMGMNVVSAGRVTRPDDSYEVIVSCNNDIYKKVLLKDGIITGMVFSGDIEKSGLIYNLMKQRTDISEFKNALVSDDFGMASLPEAHWRAIITIPEKSRQARVEKQLEAVATGVVD